MPLAGVQVTPEGLQVTATREQVRSAPDIQLQGEELAQTDESTGEDRLSLGAGGALFLPSGQRHVFAVVSPTARLISVTAPAGFDATWEFDLGALLGRRQRRASARRLVGSARWVW